MARNGRWKSWPAAWLALAFCGCTVAGSAEQAEPIVEAHAEALKTPTTGSGFLGTLVTAGITQPAHGAVLYGGEPWYNATAGANGSIIVKGGASNLPAALVNGGNLQVRLNGVYGATITGTLAMPSGAVQIMFEGTVPAVVDPTWVQREINVQIVNGANSRVLARSTNTFYDLRRENVASPYAQPEPFDGMAAHFMPGGIGDSVIDDWTVSLETPHLGMLPLDGVNAFNAALEDAVRGETVPDQPVDICFPLDEADDAFRALPQYAEVFAQAAGLLAVYEAWEQGGEKACASVASTLAAANPIIGALGGLFCAKAMDKWCVKEIPQNEDFEICFTRLEGDPEDLSIDSVSDVQLTWGTSLTGTAINAQIALAGIEGQLDGALRGASLRWIDEGRCTGRPLASVPDATLDADKDAAAATSCPDLQLSAELATTAPDTGASFLAQASGVDPQYVDVTQTVDPVLSFGETEIWSHNGVCEDMELWAAADALVESFEYTAELALNETWGADGEQAEALELLLDRLELGLIDHPSYDLSADISMMRSNSAGADVAFETKVLSTLPLVDTDKTMYYHPAFPAPFSPDGTDVSEVDFDFDMSFTINTGFLNQIISAQAKTDLLYISYEPTWEDVTERFGATPANTGHPADVDPPLDGAVLSNLHPAFAELGARTVSITVRPTLDPLAWMNPDPPLMDDANLAFGIGAMEVTIREPDKIDAATGKPVPGLVWLSARYNLREPIFDLSIRDGSDVLAIPPELSTSYLTIMSHRFTSCPMVVSSAANPCEADLADAVQALLRALIEPRMLGMLSRIPVPNVWNAGGETSAPVELHLLQQRQMNQNVTFIVDIEDN